MTREQQQRVSAHNTVTAMVPFVERSFAVAAFADESLPLLSRNPIFRGRFRRRAVYCDSDGKKTANRGEQKKKKKTLNTSDGSSSPPSPWSKIFQVRYDTRSVRIINLKNACCRVGAQPHTIACMISSTGFLGWIFTTTLAVNIRNA